MQPHNQALQAIIYLSSAQLLLGASKQTMLGAAVGAFVGLAFRCNLFGLQSVKVAHCAILLPAAEQNTCPHKAMLAIVFVPAAAAVMLHHEADIVKPCAAATRRYALLALGCQQILARQSATATHSPRRACY